jgi:hypothetical protein
MTGEMRRLRAAACFWLFLIPAVALAANGVGVAGAGVSKAGQGASAPMRQPAPLTVKVANETPEVLELVRRRREAVDPVAWAVQMASGVPVAEKELAPGVFARVEARRYDDFTIVWRLAPGVDTSAVKIAFPSGKSKLRLESPEITQAGTKSAGEWLPADDAGIVTLPRTAVKDAGDGNWTQVQSIVQVPFTTYSVTNTNDSGAGSLRQALTSANAAVGGTHVITISAAGTINLLSALPQIVNISVAINGPGAASLTVNRSSGGNYAIFETPLVLYSNALGFSGMRIQNGAGGSGGLDITGGTLTINQCVIADNFASFAGGGLGVTSTTTTITNTTFSGNSTALQGSAINAQGSTLTISNTTFSGNQITGTNGGAGAIYHFANGQALTLTNSTFSGNTSASAFGGGAALVSQNPGSYRNTVFSGQSPQISGSGASSLGNNICSDGSGNLSGAGDLPNTNPLLSALGNYGGPTPTHALLPGSPAINAGTSTGAPSADQRGISRVGAVDIGAFESRGFTMTRGGGNNQTTPVLQVFANPLSVTVASANSEPIDGGQVTFTPPASGASASIAGTPAAIAAGTATTGTVTANATIGGPYTVNATALGVGTGVSFSLTNSAPPEPSVSIAVSPASVSEDGSTNLTYTVTRSLTSASPLVVNLSTDGTATPGADFTGSAAAVTIPGNATTATLTIDPTADSTVEPDETVTLTVTAGTGYTVGTPASATGTILTDEFRSLPVNDTGKISCADSTTTPTGSVSPATPDPETAGFNEQDCTRGASAADALGVLYKQGGSSQPGRDYTKIANDGSELHNSATLGSAPGDWACTRDNTTGLVWEVKSDDGGLRDKDHRYTWYEPDANRNGGNAGSTGSDSCASTLPGGLCNIQAYRTAVNALAGSSRLCGATDWRLPDISELHTLIHYGVPTSDPSIDTTWFPNSISTTGGINFNGFYWSRDTNAKFPYTGWGVYFSPLAVGGYVEGFDKTALRHVRLVRGGQ